MKSPTAPSEVISPTFRWMRTWRRWLDPVEPHAARGPFTRWPRVADGALAAIVFAGSLVAVAASALGDDADFTVESIVDRPLGALGLLAVAAAALLWRRREAVIVSLVVMATMIVWALAAYGDGNDLALVVALYSVGRYTAEHRHSLGVVGAAIALGILDTMIDTNQRIDIAPAILLGWIPWYVGRRVRNRGDYLALLRERADRLEADQHAEALRAVTDERSRIARELHDVVAHQVSMMTIQAGAAKTIARDDLDTAVEAMGDVERSGRQALGELRHLLGVLRLDTTPDGDLGPQPGLVDIASLADELRSTGADVDVTIIAPPGKLSAAVELSAYRIVQESFTNIIKHAGRNPCVDVDVRLDDELLVVAVANTLADAPTPGLPMSGYGITGMRERATLLGGTLRAGLRSPDCFQVEAHLPTHGAER